MKNQQLIIDRKNVSQAVLSYHRAYILLIKESPEDLLLVLSLSLFDKYVFKTPKERY